MSRQDKALAVIVTVALAIAGAAWLKRRDRQLVDVAHAIDACDDEKALEYKTAPLGAPAADERRPDSRVVSWRRGGKVLTVALVTPQSGKLVVGSVRVRVDRADDPSHAMVVYEETSGLRLCR